MSADDLFQLILRAASALTWCLVIWRHSTGRMTLDRFDAAIASGLLTLVLLVIATGGFAATLHLVPGDWIRAAYTTTGVAALAGGVIVLVK